MRMFVRICEYFFLWIYYKSKWGKFKRKTKFIQKLSHIKFVRFSVVYLVYNL